MSRKLDREYHKWLYTPEVHVRKEDPDARRLAERNALNLLVIAALVQRLGGNVEISQKEIDSVAYGQLIDTCRSDGVMVLTVKTKGTSQ